jgi:hypothetical protein
MSCAPEIGRQIEARIRNEMGLTASMGVAPDKFLAKVASDHGKPDGLVVVRRESVAEFPPDASWGSSTGYLKSSARRGARSAGVFEMQELQVTCCASRPEMAAGMARGGQQSIRKQSDNLRSGEVLDHHFAVTR